MHARSSTVGRSWNLRCLWLAQFISVSGDFLFQTSVVFLVLKTETDNAALKAGAASLLCTLPFLLLGPLAGTLADRFDRRKLMLLCDVVRALLLFSAPWLHSAGMLNWLGIGALGFALSTFSAIFNPARDAFIPELAGGEELMKANAFIQSSMQMAMVAGTLLAGALLHLQQRLGLSDVQAILRLFALDGVSYVGSLVFLLAIRAPKSATARAGGDESTLLVGARDGLRHIASSRLLLPLLVLTGINNFFIMGPATVGASLLVQRTFDLSAAGVAWFEGALALGWLTGTFTLIRWCSSIPRGRLLLFGMVMDGATFLPLLMLGEVRSFPLALGLIFFHGLFIPAITVSRASILHANVPTALQGRVFSMLNFTVIGSMSLSALATGALGEHVSPPMLYFIAGAGGTVCGVVGFVVCRTLRGTM